MVVLKGVNRKERRSCNRGREGPVRGKVGDVMGVPLADMEQANAAGVQADRQGDKQTGRSSTDCI